VDDTRATADRGFTLIEIAVAVAIVATTVAAGIGISLASRSFAVSAATAEFDHLLDSARTIARETQGATLVFTPDAYGDGTEVRILAPGPNDTLVATTMPVMHTHAAIEEAQSLGKAPFALVVHASGALGGRPGYRRGDSTATGEVGCPASGSFHFVIHTAGTTADRFLPCRITLAATGPLTLASWPPATAAPLPTPCTTGPCAPTVLPTPPSSNPSCPPNYAPAPGGCNPVPPPSGPRYHVSASLASATMSIGESDTIVASADLTNPSTVPAGTPPSLPVLIQRLTDPICTATPPGPQPSGSTFALKALSPGTCTITIVADASTVPGASADNATFNVPVESPPATGATPPPAPVTCDLRANGKCYHQIVNSMSQTFYKYIVPDYRCTDINDASTCQYIDSIKEIDLGLGFDIQPVVPPTDQAHELFFEITSLRSAFSACQPFTYFENLPANVPIQWGGFGIGGPVNPPIGFGEPSKFVTSNHILTGNLPNGYLIQPSMEWNNATTFLDLLAAVALQHTGSQATFSYSSINATIQGLVWYPDFAGCDTASGATGVRHYGNAAVELVFSIFQATGTQ
jgi:prepilin-type N-terminal cleavage/methylation domain-containing protein